MSAPTRVARTTSRPPALTVAPATASPGPTSTGTGSPVSIEASTAEALHDDAVGRDLLARPHDEPVADGELRRPGIADPVAVAQTATSLAPSSSSARSAAPARRLARASKYRPARMNTVTPEATSR